MATISPTISTFVAGNPLELLRYVIHDLAGPTTTGILILSVFPGDTGNAILTKTITTTLSASGQITLVSAPYPAGVPLPDGTTRSTTAYVSYLDFTLSAADTAVMIAGRSYWAEVSILPGAYVSETFKLLPQIA